MSCQTQTNKGGSEVTRDIEFLFSLGESTIPVKVQRKYFDVASLPKPTSEIVTGFTLIFDMKKMVPSDSSVKENSDTIAVNYQSYVPFLIDRFLDKNNPNYYTKYSVKSKYQNLTKLTIHQSYPADSGKNDESFLLTNWNDIEQRHDFLIECQQYNRDSPQLPCILIWQFRNGVAAQITFNRTRLDDWRLVQAAVADLSRSIGIMKDELR